MPLRVVFTSAEVKRLQTISDLIDKARIEITGLARERDVALSDELEEIVREARVLPERLEEIARLGGPNHKDPPADN